MNDPKKYNEFQLYFKTDKKSGKKIVDVKKPTERGFVMISELDAETMNENHMKTGIIYELSDDQPEELELVNLKNEADDLGIKYHHKIGVEKLKDLIDNHKKENK